MRKGYSYREEARKKDGNVIVVHTSYRKGSKVTSANCGIIRNIKELKEQHKDDFETFIDQEAKKLYIDWKKKQKTKHTITYYEDQETEDYNPYYSIQIYLRKIWNDLGLNKEFDSIKYLKKGKYRYDLNEIMFYLATKQIIDGSSKLDAYNKKHEYFFASENKITLDSIYDSLDLLCEFQDQINLNTYKKACKYLSKNSKLYFYDVTSVNLTKNVKEGELIGLKQGKEGIYRPIIQIGYLCDEWGLLIGLLVFKGNKSEQSSLEAEIHNIFHDSKLKDIVICTDAGLCSIKNKRFAENKFKGYIVTQPLRGTKVPQIARDWAINDDFTDGVNTFKKDDIIKNYKKALEENDEQKAKELFYKTYYKSRWFKTTLKINYKGEETVDKLEKFDKDRNNLTLSKIKDGDLKLPEKGKTIKVVFEQRFVASFQLKYYYSQLEQLEEDREKAEKALTEGKDVFGRSSKDYRRFLITRKADKNGECVEEIPTSFDLEKYKKEKELCGIYCQATNLDDEPSIIYQCSRERWVIEYAFRTSKTQLGMKKVYLRKTEHVKAHFEICFLSQLLLRVFIYKIVAEYKKKHSDADFYLTQDMILDEIENMKFIIREDDSGQKCIFSQTKKNEINTFFAQAFKFSMTVQCRPYEVLNKFLK